MITYIITNSSGITPVDVETILTHVVMSSTAFIDLIVSGYQIQLIRDFIGPTTAALGYSLFTFLFFVTGATNCDDNNFIYEFIDWNDRMSSIKFCCGQILLTWTLFIAILYLSRLRNFIFSKLSCDGSQQQGYLKTFTDDDKKDEEQNENFYWKRNFHFLVSNSIIIESITWTLKNQDHDKKRLHCVSCTRLFIFLNLKQHISSTLI